MQLLMEARQEGELNVFYAAESQRPVKDPRFDPRYVQACLYV